MQPAEAGWRYSRTRREDREEIGCVDEYFDRGRSMKWQAKAIRTDSYERHSSSLNVGDLLVLV